MKESVLTTLVLPLSLFVIMLGMGLSLTPADFGRVFRRKLSFGVGLFSQLVCLPLLGWGLALGFGLEATLAVGLVLIAVCPGGVTSNLVTHVSRGDTALSISLTAVSSIVTVFSIPLVLGFALEHFLGGGAVQLPVLETIAKVFGITVLPVGLGMAVRARFLRFATAMERPVRIASTVLFVVIVAGIIAKNVDLLREHFLDLAGVLLALNVGTMVVGFLLARIARLSLPEAIAITIESGIQNGTLAIVIATSILHRGELALPAAVYSLLMFATGAVMMLIFGTRKAAPAPAAAMASIAQ